MSGAEGEHNLISPLLFVQSVRDLGLNTTDATNEFVDNSFDADAENIWITIEKNDRGGLRMIVEDDGEGIPHDKLAEVLKFGGKLDWDRDTTGKFGFGLPSAAFCQSEVTKIYSKTLSQDDFYYNRLNVNELKNMDDPGIPKTIQKDLPSHLDLHLDNDAEQGTVIIIPHMRDPIRKQVSSLTEYLSDNLGRVQREFLSKGRSIYINEKEVDISDPLLIIDESKQVELVGEKSELWGEDPIEFEYEDVEYDGEEPPKIKVYLYILPIDEIIRQDLKDDLEIGVDKQGFYIIRENREIKNSLTLNLFTRHNNLNFFRAKIEFPSELDDIFGVQTNKSRFSLDNELRQRLKQKLQPQIAEIKSEISERRSSAKSRYSTSEGMSPAETKANEKESWLPRSGYIPEDEEVEDQVEWARERLQELREKDELTDEQKSEIETKLTSIIEGGQHFEVSDEIPRSGTFYDVEWEGKFVKVKINPTHVFYKNFYRHLTDEMPPLYSSDAEIDKTDIKKYLDLLFIAMAKGEDENYQNEEIKKFYERERRSWSSYIYDFYEED